MVFFDSSGVRRWVVFLLLAAVLGWLVGSVFYLWSSINTIAEGYGGAQLRTVAMTRAIALTFDGGPHTEYTPMILRVLREEGVGATFFVTGQNALRYPALVRDLHAQGFEIANQSFSHRQGLNLPGWRQQIELNTAAFVLASVTGQFHRLYRPSLSADSVVVPVGYIYANGDIVPQVVRLQEGGGAALALRRMVQKLKFEGYQLVTLSQLLGLTAAETAPNVQLSSYGFFWVNLVGSLLRFYDNAWGRLMILVIVVMTGRFALLCIFCWFFAPRRNRRLLKDFKPWQGKVSVLVPAYNEKENIEGTIRSLMAGTRKPDEIIIINDGSKDGTAGIANRLSLFCEGRLKLLSLPNGGKATALNHGIVNSQGDVVICIDGDTVLDSEAVEKLVRFFANPQVGGVAGKVLPANNEKWLERFQTIEYLCGQDIEKRGMSAFNGITVIPGAIGAWSRKALIRAGLYSHDTLVEDMDLTLAVTKTGYKIVYEPDAIAYSETPQTQSQLLMQRFRWNYGILQCLWKYRRDFLNPGAGVIGWLVLPYQVFCIFIALTAALVYALSLLSTLINPAATDHLLYWAVFLLVNIIYAVLALWRHPKLRPLIWLTPAQQLYTSFLTAYILIRAALTALSGVPTRWQKLIRTGSAQKMLQQQ